MAGRAVRRMIERLRGRAFAGWNSRQLRSILEGVGCRCHEKKHIVCLYELPDSLLRITIPRGDDLLLVYPRETLKIVEAIEKHELGEEEAE